MRQDQVSWKNAERWADAQAIAAAKGYNLPAKFILHTVGPIWQGGNDNEDKLLKSCYRSCFALARKHHIGTLAFPSISTGVYRFPVERASRIALQEIIHERILRVLSSYALIGEHMKHMESMNRKYLKHNSVLQTREL